MKLQTLRINLQETIVFDPTPNLVNPIVAHYQEHRNELKVVAGLQSRIDEATDALFDAGIGKNSDDSATVEIVDGPTVKFWSDDQ